MEKDNKEQLLIGAHPLDFNENMDVIFSIAQKIEAILANRNSEKNNRFEKEHPNIIALLGARGSGKTSILYTLGNVVIDSNKSDYDNLGKYKSLLNNAYVLRKLVDPSMLNGENNILKLILSLLFYDFINREDAGELDNYQEIINCFIKTNEIMNCITQEKREFEPLQNLLDSQNVFKLRGVIKELIDKFLSISFINKKYLLILIDDIDLNVLSCYEMLEQLRKYLDLENVVIVLSGNSEDFELSLLNEYSKQFEHVIKLPYDDLEKDNLRKIQQLAKNYLIKIVPFPYRIDLNLAAEKAKNNYKKLILDCLEEYGISLKVFKDNAPLMKILFGNNLREIVHYYYLLMNIKKQVEDEKPKEKRISRFLQILSEHILINEEVKVLISNQGIEDFDGRDFSLPFVENKALFVDVKENDIKNWFFTIIHLSSKLNSKNIFNFFGALCIEEYALLTDETLITRFENEVKIGNQRKRILIFFQDCGNTLGYYLWDILDQEEFQKNMILVSYFLSIIRLARLEGNIEKHLNQLVSIVKLIGDSKLSNSFHKLIPYMKEDFSKKSSSVSLKFSRMRKLSSLFEFLDELKTKKRFITFEEFKKTIAERVDLNTNEVQRNIELVVPKSELNYVKSFKEDDFNDETLREKYISTLSSIIRGLIKVL